MYNSDGEDDVETLRAIQRRFDRYKSNAMNKKSFSPDKAGMVVAEVAPRKETLHNLSEPAKSMTQNEEFRESDTTELHDAEDGTHNIPVKAFIYSQFPKSAQNFIDVLKKNRSCQKFMRRKLIEIEAKIEENKELRERIKCLMDFQVACKRKTGRMLCQEKDPRIKLISSRKSSTGKIPKLQTCQKKVPTLCSGPIENSHVSKYKTVMKRFPVSLCKLQWSNMENETLVKRLKQQYQEMVILSSMNFESERESSGYWSSVPDLPSSYLEVTPEKIRSFIPLVDWDRLASMYLTGRSGAECESRWLNCEDPMVNHNPWTIIEDKKLLYTVQERGVYNWIDIAIALAMHRTPFQCLVRYQRSLNPHILNKDWSDEEDTRLRAAVQVFGHDWQVIASNIEGRSGTQCSNRWRNTLHPDRKKVGRWSVDEDKRLKVAVMLFGARCWNKIAQFAPGRTQVQCRERWLNCLDPSLNLEPWTEEEDAKLLSALAEHGYSWSKVAMCVPPRTDNQCRRRWKTLVPKEVPVLQAVKKMKRAVLISNFVDRESERPLIGPGDFLAVLPHTAEDGNNNTVEKKTPRKSRAKSKRSIEKKVKADGTLNSSADTVPSDSYLIVGLSSTGAESGSLKRSGKEPSSDNQVKKSRDKPDNFLEQKLEADPMTNLYSKVSVDHSSPLPCSNSVTNAIASMKRTLKRTSSCKLPKMSRVKQESSLEGNMTEDGTTKPSTEAAVAALSDVPCVDTGSVERGSNKDNRENIKESWSC